MEPEAESVEIPIDNVFYLLSYAWRRLDEAALVDVDISGATDLLNLFARVLASGTEHLLKRGLDRGYVEVSDATSSLRGRIGFSESLKRNLLPNARAWCTYDELTYDVPHNRILKGTLKRLGCSRQVDKDLRDTLNGLFRRINPVEDIDIRSRDFRNVRIHRNNTFYALLMNICEVIHEHWLPDEGAGEHQFRDFSRDRYAMAKLFEDFVRQFYRHEQSTFQVSAKKLAWQNVYGASEALNLLPSLNTDITLSSKERTLVIDTKFYKKTKVVHRGKEMVNPAHLNQIFAYVTNVQTEEGKTADAVDGVLLYPTVDDGLDWEVQLHGHRIRAVTVDLSQSPASVHEQLLRLLG